MTKRHASFRPTLILLVFLSFVGLYLYFFTDNDVFWGGFIAMMFFYGVIFYLGNYAANLRQANNATDVMLAGRSIPLWIAIFTMSATWVGGGYINGTAEYTATDGYGLMWVQAPWGYAMSLIIGGLFFARIMRRYEFKTMLDPLAQRYGKRMAAVLFLPALSGEIFWTSAILTALGTTFGTVLGLDFAAAIILSAIIAIAYTALGGLWAVALTDIVQMILLFVGLILVIPYALETTGGLDATWAAYVEKKGALASLIPTREALGSYYWNWWDYALLLMFGGIPWQVYFQRVLSSKDEKTARNLSIIAGFVCLLAAIPAVLIGIIGDVAPWDAAQQAALTETPALTLPYVIRYLTPGFVATIGLGAIAAAVMSSADSSILSASSMASWNVYRPLVKPDISSENLTKVIKRCIWIIGIAATLLALQVQSVYALWFLCSDFVYCLLFPQLVTALFDKKANTYGSIAGFTVAFILRFGGGDPTLGLPIVIPYPMIEYDFIIESSIYFYPFPMIESELIIKETLLFPFRTLAMVCGLLTIIIVSRLTQKACPPTVLRKEV